jgi:hypothetical protein
MRVPIPTRPPPRAVAIVARALWDTHWREETAMLFPSHISFFPPSAKKAAWTLALHELISVSNLSDEHTPLPKYYTLKLETIGRIHYIAFCSHEGRQAMSMAILECFSELAAEWRAVPSGLLGDPRDGFLLRSGKWQPAGRLVLNSRRFFFDQRAAASQEGGGSGAGSGGGGGLNSSFVDFSVRLLQQVATLDSITATATATSAAAEAADAGDDAGGGGESSSLRIKLGIFGPDSDGNFAGR